jgi:hypothetical protein
VATGPIHERQGVGERRGIVNFTGVKVFSATKAREREDLGEKLTDWMRHNPNARIIDKIVTQSSDREFHCLTITIFYETLSEQAATAA